MKKNSMLIVIAIAIAILAFVIASRERIIHIRIPHPVHPHFVHPPVED